MFQVAAGQTVVSSVKNQEQREPVLKDLYGRSTDLDDPGILFYDFSSKRFFYKNQLVSNLSNIKVNYGEEFRIKVLNINRYNYNVEFSVDNIEFGSEQPKLFKELFTGSGDYLNNLLTELQNSKTIIKSVNGASDTSEFSSVLDSFMIDYYKLVDKQLEAYSYCPANITDCNGKPDTKVLFSDMAMKLLHLKVSYQDYHEGKANGLSEIKKDLQDSEDSLKSCNEKKEQLLDQIKKNPKDSVKIKKKIKALGCDKWQENINEITKNKSDIETSLAQLDKFWTVIARISDEDLMKLTLFNNNFVADNFSYVSPPIYPEGNMIDIGLKFKPSDSGLVKKWNIMPLYSDSLGLNIFVKSKTFVSFSSGPFIGIGKNIRGETYGWQPQPDAGGIVPDSAKYKLVSTGNGNIPVGIAAFANVGAKFSEGFGWAVSPGVGITAETNPRPVYFLGGSLNFGKKDMFSLTGGLAFVYADQLKSALYPDPGVTQYKKTDAIAYSKELKVGGFISISYTVFSFDKTKSIKSGIKK